jgi:predicted HAD superfamily Cof-like phosphohydrolase
MEISNNNNLNKSTKIDENIREEDEELEVEEINTYYPDEFEDENNDDVISQNQEQVNINNSGQVSIQNVNTLITNICYIQNQPKNIIIQSDTEKVKEFTRDSGFDVPDKPEIMKEEDIKFIVKMVLSELLELISTIITFNGERRQFIYNCLDECDLPKNVFDIHNNNKIPRIAEQSDSAVDIIYYLYNAFCKKGINLSKIFNLVHQANMNKLFPDGTFHKREDGKIIKPEGWKEPDIEKEIINQTKYGSWN